MRVFVQVLSFAKAHYTTHPDNSIDSGFTQTGDAFTPPAAKEELEVVNT
jgi:hypothetical protein